ncbi:TolC family protein [Xylophilus sp.]|uniref:TolC family protein n=1 Tax=Xylophilus sp. TaxID=2653893 RepID=UPI002D7F5633|nr:TolC family protein [Xylophilus sp.]
MIRSVPPTRSCAAAVLAVLLAAGCTAPVPAPLPADAAPAAWSQPAPAGSAAAPVLRAWWKQFGDPALDALVDEALARNLDLAQAAGRLRQARLQAGRADAQFRPAFSAGARTVQDVAAIDNYFQASIDMAWEFGLFGAADAARRAGAAGIQDAAAELQAVRVAVVADVARHWLDLRTARAQQALAGRIAALDDRAAALAEVRLRTHLGTSDELAQARARAAQSHAQEALPREAATRAALVLAVLLGRPAPDAAWTQGPVQPAPVLAAFTVDALPGDLVRTRPDIRRAEADVERAAAALGISRSELYPRLALSGRLLYSYNLTQNRRNSTENQPALGPVIDIPLFDWGRRRAQADADAIGLDNATLAWRRAVQDGVAEADGALAALARQGERAAALDQARALLAAQAGTQARRATLGLASEYDGLPLRRDLLQAEADLATARAARSLAFIALYKALGGAPLPAGEDTPVASAEGAAR